MKAVKRVQVRDLPFENRWYEPDGEGAIKTPQLVKKRESGGLIADNFWAAVALTQACRVYGKGKVYCLFNGPARPEPEATDPDAWQVYSIRTSVASLVYVPEHWTAERQAEWDGLSASDQLHRCWAPHGWVSAECPVLPFDVVVGRAGDEDPQSIRFSSSLSAPVVFLVTPRLFAALRDDLVAGCEQNTLSTEEGTVCSSWYQVSDKTSLRRWERAGMEAVVAYLHRLCSERHDLLDRMGKMNEQARSLYQKALPFTRAVEATTKQQQTVGEDGRATIRGRTQLARSAVAQGMGYKHVHDLLQADEGEDDGPQWQSARQRNTIKKRKVGK